MASHALAKVAAVRHRFEAKAERAERGLVALATGYAHGEAAKRSILPVTVAGVPTDPLLGAGLLLLAAKSHGATRRIADTAGVSILAIYGHKAAVAGTFIAGEDG